MTKKIQFNSLGSWLYRRIASVATCRLRLGDHGYVDLHNKFTIASFADVFGQPFYWLMSPYIPKKPKRVIDCGGHCGHFTILFELAARGVGCDLSQVQYDLIEPNSYLHETIKRTMQGFNLGDRSRLHKALLGKKSGTDDLAIQPQNYLVSSVNTESNHDQKTIQSIPYITLDSLVGETEWIDVLKIDIEGGEYELFATQGEILNRVRVLVIEVHQTTPEKRVAFDSVIAGSGLRLAFEPLLANGQELHLYIR